jgi:hypothetical protein
MSPVILIYIGAVMTIIWGVGHLFPTKNVVKDFGEISEDNKHIITMEWINEGATLIFIGALLITVTLINSLSQVTEYVYILSIIMLITLAVISLFTGFRVNFLPYKLCPVIFTSSAVLIILGMVL